MPLDPGVTITLMLVLAWPLSALAGFAESDGLDAAERPSSSAGLRTAPPSAYALRPDDVPPYSFRSLALPSEPERAILLIYPSP